ARRLCPHCKVQATIPSEELIAEGFTADEVDRLTIYQANEEGCDRCTKGFKGRIGLYQVMPVTEAIGRIIMEGVVSTIFRTFHLGRRPDRFTRLRLVSPCP